jgi:hypothetical protein
MRETMKNTVAALIGVALVVLPCEAALAMDKPVAGTEATITISLGGITCDITPCPCAPKKDCGMCIACRWDW